LGPVTINATGDNTLMLYTDGYFLDVGRDWRKTKSYTLAQPPRILAVLCSLDREGVRGGILVSASNGVLSDSSWRCINNPGISARWAEVKKLLDNVL
jgi:hypothetical protein